jgi:hypothetical protein
MPQITKAMLVTGALNEIEKAVFLKEVNRIGKETASVHIQNAKEPQRITRGERCCAEQSSCFSIKSYVDPQSKDQLAQSVVQKIKELEEQHTAFKKAKNGYLGRYTQYWHKTGHNGPFIILESHFYDKQSLLDILGQQ